MKRTYDLISRAFGRFRDLIIILEKARVLSIKTEWLKGFFERSMDIVLNIRKVRGLNEKQQHLWIFDLFSNGIINRIGL